MTNAEIRGQFDGAQTPPRRHRADVEQPPLIVGIGGALRPGSSTERALRLSLLYAEELGAETQLFTGSDLELPIYSPERFDRTPQCKVLVDAIRHADGIIIASPGYHGSVSGLIKNVLDYTEDLRDAPQPYFDGRAVGCIATGAGWQGCVATLGALRNIVHALRGWPTPLGAVLNTTDALFDERGVCRAPAADSQLRAVAAQVVEFAHRAREAKAA